MTGNVRQIFLLFALLQLSLLHAAFASDQSSPSDRAVTLYSEEPLVSAYGIIIRDTVGKKDDNNTRPATLKKETGSRWQLTIELQPEDVAAGVRYSGVAVTKSGRVVPSEVRWVVEPEPQAFVSTRCTENTNASEDARLRTLSKEELDTLLQVRQTRAQILAKKLRESLDAKALAQLTALEKEFGFTYPRTLSRDLPLAELAYRIGVIEALLASR